MSPNKHIDLDVFYIQDARSYPDGYVLWWKPDSSGYTTKISEAGKYSREDAANRIQNRSTDIPFKCELIDGHGDRIERKRLQEIIEEIVTKII